MQQYNKYFSAIWGVLSPISMAFWLGIKGTFSIERWIEYSIGMLFLYLIYNSRSLRNKGSQTMLISIGIVTLGYAFKIMHWPYAFEMLVFGTISICFAYLFFFLKYTGKKILDILKLTWLFLVASRVIIYLFRLPIISTLDYIIGLLLVLIYILVARYELLGIDQSEISEESPELPDDVL